MIVLPVVVQFSSLGSRFRVFGIIFALLLATSDSGVDLLQTLPDALGDWRFGWQVVTGHSEAPLVGGVLHVDDLTIGGFVRVGTLLYQDSIGVGVEVLKVAGLLVDDVVSGLVLSFVAAIFTLLLVILQNWNPSGGFVVDSLLHILLMIIVVVVLLRKSVGGYQQ